MSQDPLVIFTPSGKRGRFPVGTPILTAARQLGVDLDSVCGGRGICSKCQITPGYGSFPKHGVDVAEGALSEWNAVEQRYDDKRGLTKGRRLGCQASVESDIVIDVPPESQVHKQVVRKRVEARQIHLDPSVKLYYVEVQEPDMHDPSGDLERLRTALKDQWQLENVHADLHILHVLQPVLRKGSWKVTVAVHLGDEENAPRIMHVWPGYFEGTVYGLAVDLGSTTIAAHLCDLSTGEVIASSGIMNPQIRFGEDLMSRVSYAMMNTGGDAEMTAAVREGMNALFTQISAEAEIDKALIVDAVFVCNPVMHHLLLGIDPFELGQAPFALATSEALRLRARDLELNIHPSARVYLLPCIAGHVGADAAAVALSEAPDKSEDLVLVVDVGTNAEILLGNTEKVLACSSPTGPAFEGAQISGGQRAAPGAIERVEIDPATKEPRFRVIGSDLWSDEDGFEAALPPGGITGICGSGIIEVIAEMRLAGIVDASGLIGSAAQTGSARCEPDGRTQAYLLHDGSAQGGPRITITNPDIRAIQMAKAALYSGARLLMDKFGVDKVDRVVLAGAFGAHISAKHAMVLGMIPDAPLARVTSAGNAAGTGARIALLNRAARAEIENTVQRIHKVETAIEPRFQEHFVNASALPNSAEPFPILESVVSLPDVSFNTGGSGEAEGARRAAQAAPGLIVRTNADQAEYWSSPSGQSWVQHQIAMDSVLEPVLSLVLERAALSEGMQVVDIGCGTGAGVLKAAEIVGPGGSVAGFDISPVLLSLAKSRAAHLPQTRFIEGDAQTYAFDTGSADALISRFGVMFFADTTIAFANMARALKPNGRMTMAAWGPAHRNPWFMVPAKVAKAHLGEVPKTDRTLPGPFAFEDKDRTHSMLNAAGLTVEIDTVDITLDGGPDMAAAGALCSQIGPAASVLRQKDGTESDRRAIAQGIADAFAPWMTDRLAIPATIHIITASA